MRNDHHACATNYLNIRFYFEVVLAVFLLVWLEFVTVVLLSGSVRRKLLNDL